MATVAVAPSAIDLSIQGSFPIRIGDSITRPGAGSRWTGVRFNYKPSVNGQGTIIKVNRGSRDGETSISLESDEGTYGYTGSYAGAMDMYMLLCKGQGKDKEMVLERVDSRHDFNLTSTPTERDAGTLVQRYPHLPDEGYEEEDLFGEDGADSPPDETNPFDWRHFLKAEPEKVEVTNSSQDVPKRAPQGRSTANTAISKPAAKRAEPKSTKRKPTTSVTKEPNRKRVKAGQEDKPSSPTANNAKPKPAQQVPTVRLDRKASIRRPSLEDSGELILEDDETPVSEKPKGAMALALAGQLRQGPMSLQSAASSPMSRIASPAVASPEEYTFEFDGSDAEDEEPESLHEALAMGQSRTDRDRSDDAEDVDATSDADVEDLELPSPAQEHRLSVSAATVNGPADEEGDLEGDLALALMQEFDDGAQESEESEEE